jgi:tetratricopeptide (TPR) repeat protein
MTTRILCAFLAGAGLIAPLQAQPGRDCRNSQAAQEMAKGIGAFKQAEYAKAVEHFRSAVELEAGCTNARLYLATAYMQQYIPGLDSAENLAMADAAREQFDSILKQEPDNEIALASLASLCFNQKKLDEATTWYKKLVLVKPDNKEAFYTLGVIAWTRSYEPIRKARQNLGMKPDDPGPIKDDEVRRELRVNYLPVLEEGLDGLDRALAIDGEYDDAMAYLNLLYRAKADLEDSPQDYRDDVAKADEWFRKVLETRKAKAERKR